MIFRRIALIPVLSLTMALSGCATTQEEGPAASSRARSVEQAPILYDVEFRGTDDSALISTLRSVSQALLEKGDPPSSRLILRQRARNDVPTLISSLRGLGYYEATVDYAIETVDPPQEPEQPPGVRRTRPEPELDARIIFTVDPGRQFVFGDRTIIVTSEYDLDLPNPGNLGLNRHEPAVASKVLDAEKELLRRIRRDGYPFAKLEERIAEVDFDTAIMDVVINAMSGPRADIGRVEIVGESEVDEGFLYDMLRLESGTQYDPRVVNAARQRLIETGLFSTVRVVEGEELDDDGTLPVSFDVTERKHRSIGGGVNYRTDLGPGIQLFWENRNLFNHGERLRIGTDVAEDRQEIRGRFRKPNFLDYDQALVANSRAANETTDAYESTSVEAGVGLEKVFTPHVSGTLGVNYRFADIQDRNEDDELFGLLSFPGNLFLNYSDDLLDPTTGWRLNLNGAPFVDVLGVGTNFFKSDAATTRYFRFANSPRTVLALRAAAGSIIGATRSAVPADERFFAGGGGSVRGFGYQLAGPVDDDDDPLGGTSMFEFGSEVRVKAFGEVELVTFLDGGTVFSSAIPDFSEKLRFGTGVGMRYISPVGPLRLDVGFPINRRNDIDAPFHIYFSIGQAF